MIKIGLTASQADQAAYMKDTNEETTLESRASFTLACVISKSNNKQCTETAVRAVLHHSSGCSIQLVIQAAKRFSEVFRNTARSLTIDDTAGNSSSDGMKLSASGYGRIMASMALHCSDPLGLSEYLSTPNGNENTFTDVQLVYKK